VYPEPPLVGSAVALRAFRADDFDAALAVGNDASTTWGSAMPAADGAGVVEYLERCRRDGALVLLVIADRADDGYLGEVMLALGEQGVGELGCLLAPEARGRGCAVEALQLLVAWAFETLRLARLQMIVAVTNDAALALARRAGFHREGVLRSYLEFDGARIDAVILSRLPGD